MSAINTGTINVNYPVAGTNNSSEGFRTNFSGIKNNLDTAGAEITDLQNKVIVKSALTGITLNNDMANTLISNALTLGFRATTFNLGNNLSGTVSIDLTKGDVHYGTITDDISLQFSKWAPTGTQSNVQLILTVSDPSAEYTITLPANVTNGMTTLENYSGNGSSGGTIVVPNGISLLHYNFTTINCGTNIEVQPLDRPRNGLCVTVPASASSPGYPGQIAYDSGYVYVCVATDTWKRASLSTW